MICFLIKNTEIKNTIYIPKYYDPTIRDELERLDNTHFLVTIDELISEGILAVSTGDEIGKMAYGTGDIPFIRTSDISNWEIKTIPKQGISKSIYEVYSQKQDVQEGDIFLVRDGTYLIGTNCIITNLDLPMLYQSHILKFRVCNSSRISPYLLFLVINSSIVQRQIRNRQFTADIIDTIGNRYNDVVLPIPRESKQQDLLITNAIKAINTRTKYKALIKQFPILMESALETGSGLCFDNFMNLDISEIKSKMVQDTVTLEFGNSTYFNISSSEIANNIYLPKYYDPTIKEELEKLQNSCDLKKISSLISDGILVFSTGDEIGKMSYDTGNIPFIRTSDFSNWEIKHDAKQGVSEEIYANYAVTEDVRIDDILLVRDGTYLVGSSCIITEHDSKILFCGGLYKIRTTNPDVLSPYLLLALLNSYIVKRQIRTKQFTRDVIDTLGKRIEEVVLPIPKSEVLRKEISDRVYSIITKRIAARNEIKELSEKCIQTCF